MGCAMKRTCACWKNQLIYRVVGSVDRCPHCDSAIYYVGAMTTKSVLFVFEESAHICTCGHCGHIWYNEL